MQLPLQTFTNLVQSMAAAVQASAVQFLDLTVGSTLRAILEASASVALWLQWLIVLVLQMTRAATSTGADLDSWMADFSLSRLPASPASGLVTFSRFTTSTVALVPVGALLRTVDGSQTFAVTADTSSPAWDPSMNGYLIGNGVGSINIPVVAQTAGTCGNVQAGSITVLATAISGVDTVSNYNAFQNGIDAESDAAFRLRFQTYLSSLSRATLGAVENAITSVQQGLNYTIQENQDAAGSYLLGNFIIVVDDGSGYPSNGLLAMVTQAVGAVRPIGSTFAVFAPTVTQADISLTVEAGSTSTASVIPSIVSTITTYIDGLPVGAPLPVSRIIQLAYAASSSVTNVTAVLLNSQTSDLTVTSFGVIKAGAVVVS